MATDPQIRIMPILAVGSFAATTTIAVGPFSNAITIRRFIENSTTEGSGTSALNADDAGTAGTGTTAIADKSAATVPITGVVTEANNVGAADGYKLAAGNILKVTVTNATATIAGYGLTMEYVDGVG